MPPLRIAIIGWGMAGPALALALARRGQRVTAFERVEASQPVGAGILIQPTGMQALAELGVLDEVGRNATPVRRLFGRTAGGRTVMDIAYQDRAPGLYGLGPVGRTSPRSPARLRAAPPRPPPLLPARQPLADAHLPEPPVLAGAASGPALPPPLPPALGAGPRARQPRRPRRPRPWALHLPAAGGGPRLEEPAGQRGARGAGISAGPLTLTALQGCRGTSGCE